MRKYKDRLPGMQFRTYWAPTRVAMARKLGDTQEYVPLDGVHRHLLGIGYVCRVRSLTRADSESMEVAESHQAVRFLVDVNNWPVLAAKRMVGMLTELWPSNTELEYITKALAMMGVMWELGILDNWGNWNHQNLLTGPIVKMLHDNETYFRLLTARDEWETTYETGDSGLILDVPHSR